MLGPPVPSPDPMTDARAQSDTSDPGKAAEYREVQTWWDRYVEARQFDEAIHKQYAKDRAYARGDSGHAVDVNLCGTFIEISESFLIAKNPDLDVTPSPACAVPDASLIAEAAAEVAQTQGQQAGQAVMAQGVPMAMAQGLDPQSAAQAVAPGAQMAEQGAGSQALTMALDTIQKHYQQRQRDAKALAETIELTVAEAWQKAKLKRRGRRLVRSGLSVGLGVLKATFQERTAPSPATQTQLDDVKARMLRVRAQLAGMEADDAGRPEAEAQARTLVETLKGLQASPPEVLDRRFVLDVVRPENWTVAQGFPIGDAEDAPWQAERIPMLLDHAKSAYPAIPADQWGQAAKYQARKPEAVKSESAAVTPADAKAAEGWVQSDDGKGPVYVMGIEIWDADAKLVRTLIEGIKCWAKPAWTPPPVERFYPYFQLPIGETGEDRHPVSLVARSAKLFDEYNRITSQERLHRRRCLPKLAINGGALDPSELKKLTDAEVGEIVALMFMQPDAKITDLLKEVAYPAFDAALYDRSRVRSELETIWGIQEALAGSVEAAKTATEADIQQQGFNSRTSGRREALDQLLNELATYTAQLLRAKLTVAEVRAIAGPHAYWPAYEGPGKDELRLVTVDIVAGSSGKPNSQMDKQNWSTLLPILQSGVSMIGQLRGSLPTDVADAQAKVLRLTVERLGERLDVDDLLPKAAPMLPATPNAAPGMDPNAPADPAAAAPQGAPMAA